jgi:hypothetical protein
MYHQVYTKLVILRLDMKKINLGLVAILFFHIQLQF